VTLDDSFSASWKAEVLARRPLILPRRHFTYPKAVEEIERGAMEVMVHPADGEPFLATCALGFASPSVPTGLWTCPNPHVLCAVAGGYGYVIDSRAPEQGRQIDYRPVTEVRPIPEAGLIVFVSFHTAEAWDAHGRRWQTRKLSWEGIRLGDATATHLRGWGWELQTDREVEFVIDLATGTHSGGPHFPS